MRVVGGMLSQRSCVSMRICGGHAYAANGEGMPPIAKAAKQRAWPCQNPPALPQPYGMSKPKTSPAATGDRQRLVLCYPLEARHVAQISAVAPDHQIIDAGQERVAEELPNADLFCGHPKVPVPWEDVVRRGRLKWIQSSAAGLDHCLVPPVVESDVIVTSASGVLANQVADHTMALLTGILRNLPTFFRAQQKREFIRHPTRDLHGARIGIVGLGGNGRRLAEVLSAFRTTILATDWFPVNKPAHVAELLPADALDEILPRIDILILAAPLTEHTRHMMNARTLRLLPRGAILINMARGPLVVEKDLADALTSGQLGGAGIDVTEVEPLPADSPLWEIPNLIITPHVGGQCATRADDITNFFCDNLARYLAGRPLRNLVDKRLGFPLPEPAAM
jgi:phosphoglycerate dehydrogenase-like enzyme